MFPLIFYPEVTMLQTDLRAILAEARDVLAGAQVSPRRFFLLYLLLDAAMRLANYFANLSSADSLLPFSNPAGMFVTVLVNLLTVVLGAGCCLYCLAIRRGERAEFLTLFDGFSFVGRIILVSLLQYSVAMLWSIPASLVMGLLLGSPAVVLAAPLLVLPLMAIYRYSFALYNLCEDPDIGILRAMELSKRQTHGRLTALLLLDLRFLGWIILAFLPTIAAFVINYMTLMGTPMPMLPLPLSLVLQLIFPVAVGMFYIPLRDTAKACLYAEAVRATGADPLATGPDDLGGFPPLN